MEWDIKCALFFENDGERRSTFEQMRMSSDTYLR